MKFKTGVCQDTNLQWKVSYSRVRCLDFYHESRKGLWEDFNQGRDIIRVFLFKRSP